VEIAMEPVSKSMKPTNVRHAMARKFSRKRRSSRQLLTKVHLMERNMYSMVNQMSIPIKSRVMLLL